MRSSKNAGFLLSIVLVAALIAAGVYLLLIRPAFESISASNTAAESARAFNSTLEIQLMQYQADFENLPETTEKIEQIQLEFAPQEDVAEVRRQIDEILVAEGLVLRTDTVSNPELSVPGQQLLGPAAQAMGRTSYTDALTYQDLYYTNFDIEFTGLYDNMVRGIARLQMNEGRYFLVSGVEFTRNTDPDDGTYTARLNLQFFTLLDPTRAIDPGTNSANVNPKTGVKVPNTPPGSALSTTAVVPAPTVSPSPGADESDESGEEE